MPSPMYQCLVALWIVFITVQGKSESDICPSRPTKNVEFNGQRFISSEELSHMSLSLQSDDVYFSSVNSIHHLSGDLRLKESYHYDETQNASLKLVVIDSDNQVIVVCRTFKNGTCYRHSMHNVTAEVRLLNGSDQTSGHIISMSGSTVGIVAPYGQKENSFYFARTLDPESPHKDQHSVSRRFWNSGMDDIVLGKVSTVQGSIYSEITVSESYIRSYRIEYLFVFSHNGFTYFVTRQLKTTTSKKYEIRLARVCQNDATFHSYMELTLGCKSRTIKGHFRSPVDAYLAKVSSDFKLRNKDTQAGDTVLFLLCERTDSEEGDVLNGYIVCPYVLSEVENSFREGITKCIEQFSYSPGLQFFFDGSPRRGMCGSSSDDEILVCPVPSKLISNIHVEKTLAGKNILVDRHGEDISFTSAPTSLAVTNYGNHTVLVMGTYSGRVHIFDIGAFEPMGTPAITLELSKEPFGAQLEIRNSEIYAIAGSSGYRQPLKDVCRYITTCRQCVLSNYMQCGYCSGVGCSTERHCKKLNASWSRTECPSKVISIHPINGPMEGGTVVTICGEALGHTTPHGKVETVRKVSVKDFANCTATNDEEYNRLSCVMETKDAGRKEVFRSSINLHIVAPQPPMGFENEPFRIDSSLEFGTFTFYPVEVHDIHPRYGSEVGGTELQINGNHLDVGNDASVTVGTSPCAIKNRSSTTILCVTEAKNHTDTVKKSKLFDEIIDTDKMSSSEVTVTIDNAVKSSPQGFQYMPSPFLKMPTAPFKSIYSGGIHIRVPGVNLKSVANPHAIIEARGMDAQTVPCTVVSGPKGEVKYLQLITPSLRNGRSPRLQATVTFKLDGLMEEHGMIVKSDPDIDESSVAKQEEDSLKIFIQGHYLKNACQNNPTYSICDYKVYIGDVLCPDIDVTEDTLICKVKRNQVENDAMPNNGSLTVHVGAYLKFSAGKLVMPASSMGTIIGGAVAGVVVLIFIIVIACLVSKRRKKKATSEATVVYRPQESNQESNMYHGSNMRNGNGHDTEPLLSPVSIREHLPRELLAEMSPLLIPPSRLKYDRTDIIGKGNFGIVFHGTYYPTDSLQEGSGEKVAIKTMSKIDSVHSVEQFLKEALIMSDFKDDHVLTLIGVLMDESSSPMVVLPFMKHGDLLMFIRNPDNTPTVKDLVGFGLQACKGMRYLASNRFVHRDLAARNCMLDEEYTVKVADFGLARDIYEKEYYKPHDRVGRMPVKWMALESLQQQKFTTKTDVWSFGILLWELMTRGVTPYPDVDAFDVTNYLLDGRRLKQTDFCPDDLYQLMIQCWNANPDERPNFNKLVEILTKIHNEIHGVHYPGLDITYVNMDTHPYPSLLRTAASRSTGGSEVFTPGTPGSYMKSAVAPPTPPRNPLTSTDAVFPPSAQMLSKEVPAPSTPLLQDEEGYLMPSTSGTPKSAGGQAPTFMRPRKSGEQEEKELTVRISGNAEVQNHSPRTPKTEDRTIREAESAGDMAQAIKGADQPKKAADSVPSVLSSVKNHSFVVPPSPLQGRAGAPKVAPKPKPSYVNDVLMGKQSPAQEPYSWYKNIGKDADFLSNPTYVTGVQEPDGGKTGQEEARQKNRNNGNNKGDSGERYSANPKRKEVLQPAYVDLHHDNENKYV